ncbi:Integrase/recombinase xerD [Mycena sanguinolenta]|uniref:Integrase/recombinase xerD n=1 Tax=Mycena sanguinolenta TaxID=230812 RepID=A0A8H6YVV9_9AGAR|nr:Integrase/recombinase xerD [Mycena sanguinolenta]
MTNATTQPPVDPNAASGSSTQPPLTTEQRMDQLQQQMDTLLAALKVAQQDANAAAAAAQQAVPPAPPTPPAPPVAPPAGVAPPLVIPTQQQFVPPIPPLNAPAGASPSLRSLFPDIKSACITAVITHDLEAADLYKLDVRVKDSEPTYSLSATGTFEMNMAKHKAYKNLNSVIFPLHTYFAILTSHLPGRPAATVYFYCYLTHLATLASEYEWAAVLEYHTLFFNRRRGEMLTGSYEGWATSDIGLLSTYVYPHRKPINVTAKTKKAAAAGATGAEPCRNFNSGKCESPCAWKRPHGSGRTCSPTTSSPRHGHPVDVPVPTSNRCLPPRPNTAPRANAVSLDSPSTPTIHSVLNEDAWAFYLRDYPDAEFVSVLLNIIRHGANLGFTGDKSISQTCTNLKSAFESDATFSALSSDIAAQVANGRTAGPFLTPPFENFRCSPLGAVSRKRSAKIRRIHHLSWPQGGSVNDGIADAEARIDYDMIDRAITDILKAGRGSLLVKLDLESAFRHIPVRREDWHLLGFTWENRLYHDVVLGFGCRSAPYIFNLFAEALHWILQRNLPAFIHHYLDDFLKIFAPDIPRHKVQQALEWTLALGEQLGLQFQPLKVCGPATVIEFLGIELDTIALEARLPAEKLSYLKDLLTDWPLRTHATLREIQELTGFLQFASQVIPTACAFLRGLYDFEKGFATPFSRRRLSRSARRDIAWWAMFSVEWNGIRLLSPQRRILHVYTDTSGSKGLGGHFGNHWFSVRCPRCYRKQHIQVKEMLAVVHAVLCWGEDFAGTHVIFHVDNEAVHNGISNFSIRSPPTMELLRRFLALACRLDFSFSSVWLSSSENSIADAASLVLEAPPDWWYEQHTAWPKTVSFYLWHGLASNTRRTYSTGQRSFINFCKLHSLYNTDGAILPATQPAIMSWIASLGGRVQPKTIKAYLSAVRSLHVDADLPFTICESPVVQRLIRGIKRFHGEKDRKPVQPITRPILLTILAQLQPGTIPGHTTLYAAYCLGYAGLLRSGEITTGSGSGKDASLNLTRDAIQFFPDFNSCTHIELTLPGSKTDPFRKGITITIAAAPGQPSCPVSAIKHLFTELPRAGNAPLFEGVDGKPLHYKAFVAGIRDSLTAAGIDPSGFAGHSLRRGAATEAAAAGFNDYEIQLLGRWRSDAYKLYIENPISRILQLSRQLHMAHPHSIPFEPPALRNYAPVA